MVRPNTPTALSNKHRGNSQATRSKAKLEAQLGGSGLRFEPPKDYRLSDQAAHFYRELAKLLSDTHVLREADTALVAQISDVIARIISLQNILNSKGMYKLKHTRQGVSIHMNPMLNSLMKLEKIYKMQANQLGILSPSARNQLAETGDKKQLQENDRLYQILNHVPKDLDK